MDFDRVIGNTSRALDCSFEAAGVLAKGGLAKGGHLTGLLCKMARGIEEIPVSHHSCASKLRLKLLNFTMHPFRSVKKEIVTSFLA